MKKVISILLMLSSLAAPCQTRFWTNCAAASSLSPTLNAGWNVTTGNVYYMLMPTKQSGVNCGNTSIASAASGAVAPRKMIIATFISPPLPAQTISSGSTISMQLRQQKNASAPVCSVFVYIRKCDQDGSNIADVTTMESIGMVNGTAANRTLTVTLGSNVTVSDYQRFVFEVGVDYTSGSSTTLTGSGLFTVTVTTADLPVDNTTTSINSTWLEFSQTLQLNNKGKGITL